MHVSPFTVAARAQAREIRSFNRALDETYARLRERARAEWMRLYGSHQEPADARVSVTISAAPRRAADPGRRLR